MGPRYPGGPRPGVRMPQMGPEFGGVSYDDSIMLFFYFMIYSLIITASWSAYDAQQFGSHTAR